MPTTRAAQRGSTRTRETNEAPGAARTALHQVNDRVQVHRRGTRRPGRISSVHHHENGVEYVVRLDAPDGGMGAVVNGWTTSGHSTVLTPAGGEQ
jgi:hypothetical protein